MECQRLCHEVVSFAVSGLVGLFSLLTLGWDRVKDLRGGREGSLEALWLIVRS